MVGIKKDEHTAVKENVCIFILYHSTDQFSELILQDVLILILINSITTS